MLWGFCDSTRLVIVDAGSAREALTRAEKHWLVGQTITPLGALPLNAPEIVERDIYPFDNILWQSRNEFFFDWLESSVAVDLDAATKRVIAIWNHPGLKTMSVEEHEALALELRAIAKVHGIGGENVFREMCETIREKSHGRR